MQNQVNQDLNVEENQPEEFNEGVEQMMITATINEIEYEIILEDNNTTRAFIDLLPLTIQMDDLNNNEKYFYLDAALPSDSYNPETIQPGDFMLYGNNCIVLFYKSFQSNFSYTKLGTIKNTDGLQVIAASTSIEVTFAK
ncbi:cyclophilin-like fold protein [Anaerorhabdus furcosa]|nr:cyclophilin-like fold protein [Anaerorhabdus furcosa]